MNEWPRPPRSVYWMCVCVCVWMFSMGVSWAHNTHACVEQACISITCSRFAMLKVNMRCYQLHVGGLHPTAIKIFKMYSVNISSHQSKMFEPNGTHVFQDLNYTLNKCSWHPCHHVKMSANPCGTTKMTETTAHKPHAQWESRKRIRLHLECTHITTQQANIGRPRSPNKGYDVRAGCVLGVGPWLRYDQTSAF